MKKIITIIALTVIFCAGSAVAANENVSYVKAGDKVYFGKEVKVGLFFTKITCFDGTTIKVSNKDVKSYMNESKLYEYLPVVCNNKDTVCYTMMEYVTSRSGMRLYRCACYDTKQPRYDYYVFKDNRFFLSVSKENATSILPFFGVEVIGA